jgi:hypothetical protein
MPTPHQRQGAEDRRYGCHRDPSEQRQLGVGHRHHLVQRRGVRGASGESKDRNEALVERSENGTHAQRSS